MTIIYNLKYRPFVKWVGGKRQLLKEIEKNYPFEKLNITKYVEPFVGGGAVFFDIIEKHQNQIKEFYISDINKDLINVYLTIRDNVEELVQILSNIEQEYKNLDSESDKKSYYLKKRAEFNILRLNSFDNNKIFIAALMIFLNRTCFNGLYRVNKRDEFNVPFGKYANPTICDTENLHCISKILQNVQIKCHDYKEIYKIVDENTFVYLDPPYIPLNSTSNFTQYTQDGFTINNQYELSEFANKLALKGAYVIVSNSFFGNSEYEVQKFYNKHYPNFTVRTVSAKRNINSNKNKRGIINEVLLVSQ